MLSEDSKIVMMREESIPRVLIKMGIPTMLGMIVSALYSIVDAYFAGWLGTRQVGAISVVFPIVQVIIGLGMMFGTGASSYISRLLGKGDHEQANHTAATALFSSLLVGVISITISLCFLRVILTGLGATDTIYPYAKQYAVIYITGAIFNIFNVTMNHLVAAEGRTKLTMTSMMLGGGLNVILDPIFMFVFHMGIQGAAIATVIAQAITTLIYVWYILGRKGWIRFSPAYIRIDGKIYGEIFKIGIPILVYQLLTSASLGLTNSAVSTYGDSAVAAFGVVTRILTIGTYVVFGFMKGFQPVIGYNYGAGNYERVKEAVHTSLKWSTIFCVIFAVVMLIFPAPIISVFTKHHDMELISIGVKALRASSIGLLLFGFEQVYMSLFLAMGKGKAGILLSISRQGLFFIPTILILQVLIGLNGVVWTQAIADLCTGLLTAVLALQIHRSLSVSLAH